MLGRYCLLACAAALGLSLQIVDGRAQGQLPAPVSEVIEQMSPPAADGAAQPNLVTGRGRVWLTWLEPKPGGGHRFQMSEMVGSRWNSAITIAEGTNFLANWADFPSLFAAADGTLAAHWLERGTGREAYFIRVKTSTDGGKTWTPPITPHRDASATEHGFVSFFDAPGGGVGLVWLDGRDMTMTHAPGTRGSMALRSTVIRNGAAGDDEVIDAKVCDCCQTSAARVTGAVLVAYRDRSDKEIRDTSVVRYANGAWSEPITVGNDNWEINACPVNGPVITANGNSAAVAWFTGAGNVPRTNVAFSHDGGRTFGSPIRVDTNTTLGRLAMLMPSADRVLVSSLERDAAGAQVVLRDIRRDGRTSLAVPIARTTPDRSGGFLRLARVGTRLIAAWTEVRPNLPSRISVAVMEAR